MGSQAEDCDGLRSAGAAAFAALCPELMAFLMEDRS